MGNNNNNGNNSSSSNNNSSYQQYQQQYQQSQNNNDDSVEYLTSIQQKSTATGPFNIDPLHYTEFCICILFSFALYLFIPKGYRFTFCGSYPKRYSWSSRIKKRRERRRLQGGGAFPASVGGSYSHSNGGGASVSGQTIGSYSTTNNSMMNTNHRELSTQGIGHNHSNIQSNSNNRFMNNNHYHHHHQSVPEEEEIVDFTSPQPTLPSSSSIYRTTKTPNPQYSNNTPLSTITNTSSNFNDEIAISTTMSQLRDTGIKIIAHGSKGKPKSVRLLLTENAIEWRTEMPVSSSNNKNNIKKRKVGKTHQVPLSHIMYVDVGKQTTALRRVENASISDNVCLSLLTRDGSLDLEAKSNMERDALVNCFSLVLDEVHSAKSGNWRDVYRAPSSDLPSSFDEFDMIMGSSGLGGAGGIGGRDERMEV